MRDAPALRVALLAGTLTRGGAEKQLVYMARALRDAGVTVQVLSLTRGEYFEPVLCAAGLPPRWIGRHGAPPLRVLALAAALRESRPHIVQAAHFYTNLHVALAARCVGAIAIGAIRNDTWHELEGNRRWGRALLRAPSALIANSSAAKRNAEQVGVDASTIHVVPNVIDLAELPMPAPRDHSARDAAWYDRPSRERSSLPSGSRDSDDEIVVACIARLVPAKRLDRFLAALALARREVRTLTGVIGGDGPERLRLQTTAASLGLLPAGVRFVGPVDASVLLQHADMLLMTSEHEGFPNIILEAMAAGRPVITTPAGDAGVVVEHEVTGYVVPSDDISAMAERMVRLARSPRLRCALGAAGRARVERCYSFDRLAHALLCTYRRIAERQANHRVCDALAS
ncbi:MAG TPA: glycosyltransferase family 4 protein [Gemmatimonadaceae bacterium]